MMYVRNALAASGLHSLGDAAGHMESGGGQNGKMVKWSCDLVTRGGQCIAVGVRANPLHCRIIWLHPVLSNSSGRIPGWCNDVAGKESDGILGTGICPKTGALRLREA